MANFFSSALDKGSDFLFGTYDEAYSDAARRQAGYNKEYEGSVTQALDPYKQLTDVDQTKQIQQDYVGGLTGMDTDQYKVGAPTYDRSGVTAEGIQALIDPNLKFQQKAARESLESSAAGKGGLFSSGLGRDVATSAEQLSAQAWDQAYQKDLAEKNRQNAITGQQFATDTAAGTYNLGLDTTGLQAKGTALDTMMQPMGAFSQGMMDLAGTKYGAQTGMSQQGMQIQGADKGYFGDILSAGAKLAGG